MAIDPALSAALAAMLAKASRSLEDARVLIERGSPDFGASRAYYAAFYAVEAALLAEGLIFSSHSQTIGAFNLHFLKTNILPPELSKKLDLLFQQRQVGDYEYEVDFPPDNAARDVNLAQEIVAVISAHLRGQGKIA